MAVGRTRLLYNMVLLLFIYFFVVVLCSWTLCIWRVLHSVLFLLILILSLCALDVVDPLILYALYIYSLLYCALFKQQTGQSRVYIFLSVEIISSLFSSLIYFLKENATYKEEHEDGRSGSFLLFFSLSSVVMSHMIPGRHISISHLRLIRIMSDSIRS
jgi:hypothetical protein